MSKLTPRHLTYLEGCGNLLQYCLTRRDFETGHCIFCEARTKWPKEVFYQSELVVGVVNSFPHKVAEHHLLVFPVRHVLEFAIMTKYEWADIRMAILAGEKRFGTNNGGWLTRNGDPLYGRGTIPHWHQNILKPDLKLGKEMRLPLAKKTEELEEDRLRAARFADVYERLSSEGKLEAFLCGQLQTHEPRNWDGKSDWPT